MHVVSAVGAGSAAEKLRDRYCQSDRCPILDLHRPHNVNKAIEQYVLDVLPSGSVLNTRELIDATPNIDPADLVAALKRLKGSGLIAAIYNSSVPVAYFRDDGTAVEWTDTRSTRAKRDNAVDDAILRTLGRYVLKVFWQVYRDVRHDFGEVTDRTVYRRLKILGDQQRLVHLKFGAMHDGGYVLPGSPLIHNSEDAIEQIVVANLERRCCSI